MARRPIRLFDFVFPLLVCFPAFGVGPLCVQLYNNPYPFSLISSCAATPNRPGNRPLSEHKESDQSGCGAPKCARQSNPGLLGRARAPVRLTQNRNDRTVRAGAGRTELASQSEAARATRLFATEQPGINGTRLYSEAVQGNRGYTGGLQGYIQE
jgi:hypothetical protein